MRWWPVVVGALVVASCGGGDSDREAELLAEIERLEAEVAELDETPETTTTAVQVETSPVPTSTTGPSAPTAASIGEEVELGDWRVSVTEFVPNATDQVLAANDFNEPPAEGNVYALVRLRGTYLGDDEGFLDSSLLISVLGSDQRRYDRCFWLIDDSVSDQPSLFAGGTAEGYACVEIPTTVLDGALIGVRANALFGQDEVWFQP